MKAWAIQVHTVHYSKYGTVRYGIPSFDDFVDIFRIQFLQD